MSRRQQIRFFAAVTFTVLTVHLLCSVVAALALDARYRHRLFDVRRWPLKVETEDVAEMVSAFLSARLDTAARTTVFYGSSFAYGYPWQETVVMSHRYAELRPAEVVINASVIGAQVSLVDKGILCGAANAGVHSAVAIVEIPVINSVAGIATRHLSADPNPQCNYRIGRRAYAAFAARHPLGVGWVPFIWDDKAYPKSEENFVLVKVPPGYFTPPAVFETIAPIYQAQIAEMLRSASRAADHVYAFPSPVFLPGVAEVGEDAESVRRQLDVSIDACRKVPGVECLDPQLFYTQRDAFYNMTHLNQRGHQAMAEWLSSKIAP